MFVTIIGPGAIGLFIAQRLVQKSVSVGFVGSKGPQSVHESFRACDGPIDLHIPAPTPEQLVNSNVVFVVVKAFQLADALRMARLFKFKPGTPVIVTVNGAVHELIDQEKQQSPHWLWRLGSCTFGVSRTPEGIYEQRSAYGEILFGPLVSDTEPTESEKVIMQQDPHVFVWRPEMVSLYRRKWLFNTVINTLCAVQHLPCNGELLKDMSQLEAVFDEAYRLGLELWGSWSFERESLYSGVLALIRSTAANENSMARDVRLGRQTESEFLAGLAKNAAFYPLLTDFHNRIMTSGKKPGPLS